MLYTEPRIHFINDMEIHMLSELVGVCWNVTEHNRKTTSIGGSGMFESTIVTTYTRIGKPYIAFLDLREDNTGEWYIDEDSPVAGGFSADMANKLVVSLQAAVNYVTSLAVIKSVA